MSDNLLFFLAVALVDIVIILLVLLISKVNLAKVMRHRQWVMPLVAIVYSALLLSTYAGWNDWMTQLYEYLCEQFPSIQDAESLSYPYFRVLLFNALSLILFALMKTAVLAIMKKIPDDPAQRVSFMYRFAYYYDEDESRWLLRVRFTELRRPLKWMFIIAVVLSLALMTASIAYRQEGVFQNPFYPVFVIMLLGEIYHFLNGCTKQEYLDGLYAEDEDSERIHQYFSLQQNAALRFPDRIAEAHIRYRKQDRVVSGTDLLTPYLESSDYEERLAGTFTQAIYVAMNQFMDSADKDEKRDLFEALDFDEMSRVMVDQINTMVLLLKRKNVIFASPFFRDYREFVFFPINRCLLQGGKLLVIDGQGCDRRSMVEWVSRGLQCASSIPGLWEIGYLDESDTCEEWDGGILPYPLLNDFEFLDNASDFLKDVSFVVLVNPANILAVTQIGFAHLSRLVPSADKVTYVAFDVNSDGLVDSLSHAVRAEFVEVAATGNMSVINCGLLWRADGKALYTRQFDNIMQYLGDGTEIAAFSMEMGVEKVVWSSSETVPLKDVRWIGGQYYQAISSSCGLPQSQKMLDEAIVFNPDIWNAKRVEHGYFIVEDEYANALEMQRQYATRGMRGSFVNLISGSYLLYDFMRFNEDRLLFDPKLIPLIVPDYQRSERNYMIELANQLVMDKVDTAEIVARLRLLSIDVKEEDVEGYVVSAMNRFAIFGPLGDEEEFNAANLIVWRSEAQFDVDEMDYVYRDYLCIPKAANGEPRKDVAARLEYLRNAHFIAEDEIEKGRYLGSCLYGQIQQRYLPGQFKTIEGKYYEVISVTPDSGMLLRRAADHFDMRLYYRQVKRITLSDFADESIRDRAIEYGGRRIRIELVPATVEVETFGYLKMADYADLMHSSYVDLESMGQGIAPRRYQAKTVLRITLDDATDKQLVTLGALLNELFRTMYARGYEYLCVAPKLSVPFVEDLEVQKLRGVVHELVDEGSEHAPCLYIIEDSMIDIGLVSSVERNADRLLAMAHSYIRWHIRMLILGPRLDPKRNHYVSIEQLLGIPVNFDEKEVDEGFGIESEPPKPPEGTVECDFCGRDVPKESVTELKDGRQRCPVCSETVLKSKEELKELFQSAMIMMQEYYKISFDNPISVKSVSARRLNRRLGRKFVPTSRYDARCRGFALMKRGKQVVWLENGRPRMAALTTIVHELTHVWQAQSDYFLQISKEKTDEALEIMEGMAVWSEIQFLILMGAKDDARARRNSRLRQDDEYGHGYKRYLAIYPHAMAVDELEDTPFMHPDDPLKNNGGGDEPPEDPGDSHDIPEVEVGGESTDGSDDEDDGRAGDPGEAVDGTEDSRETNSGSEDGTDEPIDDGSNGSSASGEAGGDSGKSVDGEPEDGSGEQSAGNDPAGNGGQDDGQ